MAQPPRSFSNIFPTKNRDEYSGDKKFRNNSLEINARTPNDRVFQ